jgi:hypothetical protein
VFYALPLGDVSELLHEVWNCMHLTLALVPEGREPHAHAGDAAATTPSSTAAAAESSDVRGMRADWDALLAGTVHRHIAALGPHAATLLAPPALPKHRLWHLAS